MFYFESLSSKVNEVKWKLREKVKHTEGDEKSDIQSQKAVEAESCLWH